MTSPDFLVGTWQVFRAIRENSLTFLVVLFSEVDNTIQ